MADITMSLDETLELDTIIKESSTPLDPITDITFEDSSTNNYTTKGIQTNTAVFKPEDAGKYTITVSGQELTVKVTDPSTIPDDEVDFFEDGDLSEYSGDTGEFSVQTNTVKQGTYALKGQSNSNGTANTITSSGALPHYPQRGDEFGFWLRFSAESGGEVSPVVVWAGGGYNISYREGASTWRLRRGDGTNLDTINKNPSYNTWYYIYVKDYLADGTINVDILDDNLSVLYSLSGNDNNHDTGSISFAANDSSGETTTIWVDYFGWQ